MKNSIIIGIAGGSASGKTSISRQVYEFFKGSHTTCIIKQDDYYKDQSHLSFEERVKTNYDHPFAFDNDLLVEQLKQLKEGKSISKPTYDYTMHTRSDVVETITPRDVYILEGLFVLYDEKIREIEQKILSDDFMRCHTSFLVNFSYVKECTKKKMLLENGKIVDISRSYWKKTEEAYVEWVKRWAR